MKSKHLIVLPVLALTFAGVGLVSAHGFLTREAAPEDIAERQQQMFERKAGILGISIDQIKNYWAEGKSFKEVAELEGITIEDLRTKTREAREAQMRERLQSLVQQGVITQAQADQRLRFMESRPERSEFRGFGHGFGHHFNQEAQN